MVLAKRDSHAKLFSGDIFKDLLQAGYFLFGRTAKCIRYTITSRQAFLYIISSQRFRICLPFDSPYRRPVFCIDFLHNFDINLNT